MYFDQSEVEIWRLVLVAQTLTQVPEHPGARRAPNGPLSNDWTAKMLALVSNPRDQLSMDTGMDRTGV